MTISKEEAELLAIKRNNHMSKFQRNTHYWTPVWTSTEGWRVKLEAIARPKTVAATKRLPTRGLTPPEE